MPGKVVLFFPSYYSDEAAPPLALLHLAAPLVERGYDVRIVDSAVADDPEGDVLAHLPIVAGGWHPSILPEQTLRSPLFDAVV